MLLARAAYSSLRAMPTPAPKKKTRPNSARRRAASCQPGEPMPGEFVPMEKWDGPRPGMIYKVGAWGPGYYLTASQQRSNRSSTTDSGDAPDSATGKASNNRFRSPKGKSGAVDQSSATGGMPTDLPEDAARALGRRLDRNGVARELAVPLGGGWMQRAGRGTFERDVDCGSGSGIEVSSIEPLFYLLTYDQNPDAPIVHGAHYRLDTTFRCPTVQAGANPVSHVAVVIDWKRSRSTVTNPCFTGVVLSGNTWRLEQYSDGQRRTLGEVHDAGLNKGTASALSMAAPWHKLSVEVRGDRVHITCNKRVLFGSFMVPPHADQNLAGGRGRASTLLNGAAGIATYKSRVQIKSFEFVPLEGGTVGGGTHAEGMRTPRPPFTGGEPKLVELIEGDMLESAPQVSWESIGGLEPAKRLLNEAVVLPLLIPEYFAAAACRSTWKGVLLFGPPGTGKTLLARAVASLGKTAFFNISASSLVSHYHGESEKLVRTLFALARHHAPSVVFFDEVDALVSSRGMSGEHEASRRLKSELLMQMDGVSSHTSSSSSAKENLVMVLATSNKPWDLDEAMRRRLERRIYIPLPDERSRSEMLNIYLKGVKLAPDVTFERLAQRTEGYSGADMQLACRDASMMPMRRAVDGKTPSEIIELHEQGALEAEVGMADFGLALEHTQPSVTLEETSAFAAWNREHGSTGSGGLSGANLATPNRPVAGTGSNSTAPRTRIAPMALDGDEDTEQEPELVQDVC